LRWILNQFAVDNYYPYDVTHYILKLYYKLSEMKFKSFHTSFGYSDVRLFNPRGEFSLILEDRNDSIHPKS